jgi:hypothetical protein
MERRRRSLVTLILGAVLGAILALSPQPTSAQQPYYLYDRGDGIPTSLFGTYVRNKELLVYTFYEYTRDTTSEYKPSDMGFTGTGDFFGKLTQHEYLLFLAYGFTDSLALEFESALYTNATLEKSSRDTSNMPRRLREDGLGDTEINLRYRFLKENEIRPEGVFFFKTVFPLQEDKKLIGAQDWELSPGLLVVKGTPWGTLTGKVAMAYTSGEGKFEFGEYGVEYLKRLSPNWRVVLAFEGEQDEQQIIGEVQYALNKNVMFKLNSGFGITKKAPDFTPEVGVLFSF